MGKVKSRSMNAIRPPSAPARTEAKAGRAGIIAHVFVEPDGTLSITPTIAATPADIRRVHDDACLCRARWRSVNERLLAGRECGR
jgi:hypothetical protein